MSLFIGAISGTSIDGLDLATVKIQEQPSILHTETVKLPKQLASQLRLLTQPGSDEIRRLGRAHVAFGQFIGRAVLHHLQNINIDVAEIKAIGSHGQTIRHHPSDKPPFSLQIGDGNSIAEITGIPTVCDFRSRDLAAGGEGAPLVPIFHEVLFGDLSIPTVVLNIGGIANISVLPHSRSNSLTGYDTGPGNALLDAWILQIENKPFDEHGMWSRSGSVNDALLHLFLSHSFFTQPAPKSTGKEQFNLHFIQQALKPMDDLLAEDVQATLLELTAQTISAEIKRTEAARVIVCGGGRLNTHLMFRLRELLVGIDITTTEDYGVDGDGVEAATFAYLAYSLLLGKAGNAPLVTGAKGPRLLGCIYPGTMDTPLVLV